jgi:hypothetical protein
VRVARRGTHNLWCDTQELREHLLLDLALGRREFDVFQNPSCLSLQAR